MTSIDTSPSQSYIDDAIRQAAITLQWSASDATEVGNGYPIGDSGDEWTDDIISKVPYLTEAVTAFIENEENWRLLRIAESSASQTGHDFILTANGHGTGFWDRGYNMPADDTARAEYDRVGSVASLARLVQAAILTYRTVGDLLTANVKGYSFDSEFALWGDYADGEEHCADKVAWLMVDNEIIVDDGMIARYDDDTRGAGE